MSLNHVDQVENLNASSSHTHMSIMMDETLNENSMSSDGVSTLFLSPTSCGYYPLKPVDTFNYDAGVDNNRDTENGVCMQDNQCHSDSTVDTLADLGQGSYLGYNDKSTSRGLPPASALLRFNGDASRNAAPPPPDACHYASPQAPQSGSALLPSVASLTQKPQANYYTTHHSAQNGTYVQPSPSIPPSPYINTPSTYYSITEPGTPATQNFNNVIDHNSQMTSPSVSANFHSSNPPSLMSSVPPSPASLGSCSNSNLMQRSPSVKSVKLNSSSTPDYTSQTQIQTQQQLSQPSQPGDYGISPHQQTNEFNRSQSTSSYRPIFTPKVTRTPKSHYRGGRPKNAALASILQLRNNSSSASTTVSATASAPFGDDGPTVKEHLQQQQARQRMQQQQESGYGDWTTTGEKKTRRSSSKSSSMSNSPQKTFVQATQSQVHYTESMASSSSAAYETGGPRVFGAPPPSSSSISLSPYATTRRTATTVHLGTNQLYDRTPITVSRLDHDASDSTAARQRKSSANDALASTIASVASGASGSFDPDELEDQLEDHLEEEDTDENIRTISAAPDSVEYFNGRSATIIPQTTGGAPTNVESPMESQGMTSNFSPIAEIDAKSSRGPVTTAKGGAKRAAKGTRTAGGGSRRRATAVAPPVASDVAAERTSAYVRDQQAHQQQDYQHQDQERQPNLNGSFSSPRQFQNSIPTVIGVQHRPLVTMAQKQKQQQQQLSSSDGYEMNNQLPYNVTQQQQQQQQQQQLLYLQLQQQHQPVTVMHRQLLYPAPGPIDDSQSLQIGGPPPYHVAVQYHQPQQHATLIEGGGSGGGPVTVHTYVPQQAFRAGLPYAEPFMPTITRPQAPLFWSHKEAHDFRKYSVKLYHLRRTAKSLVYKNGALSDELARLNQRIQTVTDERRMLAKRVQHHERNRMRRLQTQQRKRAAALAADARKVVSDFIKDFDAPTTTTATPAGDTDTLVKMEESDSAESSGFGPLAHNNRFVKLEEPSGSIRTSRAFEESNRAGENCGIVTAEGEAVMPEMKAPPTPPLHTSQSLQTPQALKLSGNFALSWNLPESNENFRARSAETCNGSGSSLGALHVSGGALTDANSSFSMSLRRRAGSFTRSDMMTNDIGVSNVSAIIPSATGHKICTRSTADSHAKDTVINEIEDYDNVVAKVQLDIEDRKQRRRTISMQQEKHKLKLRRAERTDQNQLEKKVKKQKEVTGNEEDKRKDIIQHKDRKDLEEQKNQRNQKEQKDRRDRKIQKDQKDSDQKEEREKGSTKFSTSISIATPVRHSARRQERERREKAEFTSAKATDELDVKRRRSVSRNSSSASTSASASTAPTSTKTSVSTLSSNLTVNCNSSITTLTSENGISPRTRASTRRMASAICGGVVENLTKPDDVAIIKKRSTSGGGGSKRSTSATSGSLEREKITADAAVTTTIDTIMTRATSKSVARQTAVRTSIEESESDDNDSDCGNEKAELKNSSEYRNKRKRYRDEEEYAYDLEDEDDDESVDENRVHEKDSRDSLDSDKIKDKVRSGNEESDDDSEFPDHDLDPEADDDNDDEWNEEKRCFTSIRRASKLKRRISDDSPTATASKLARKNDAFGLSVIDKEYC